MKRRDFLVATGGIAGAMLPAWARAAAPCPPPALSVAGGPSASTYCGSSNDVPGAGQLLLTGTNSQYDLVAANPGRFSAAATQDGLPVSAHLLGYAHNGAYGSGTLVPGYGAQGAYVSVGMSGDTAPRIIDACVFDFATRTWQLDVNAHGIKNHISADHYPLASTESWAEPWSTDGRYEYARFPGVPKPSQMYRAVVGVGNRFLKVLGEFPGAGGIGKSGWSHQYNCTTRSWSRLSVTEGSDKSGIMPRFDYSVEPTALHDATANRVWLLLNETYGTSWLPYLDLADNTWKKSPSFPAAPTQGATTSRTWTHQILHDDGNRRCILSWRNVSPNNARVIDLNNIAAGWTPVSLVHATRAFPLPQFVGGSNALTVKWAQYPAAHGGDNCHYTYDGLSPTFTKITPPASGITGTWTISQCAQTSNAIPLRMNGGGTGETSDLCHYTRFFFVPALSCFAWVAGGTRPVALWKP